MARSTHTRQTKSAKQLANKRRELFCQYYAQNTEYFGNGTHAYAAAYDYELETLSREPVYETIYSEDDPEGEGDGFGRRKKVDDSPYDKACNVCAVEAGRLLRSPQVQERIRELLNEWMTNEAVDAELAKVIQQDNERAPKVAAIREYNKLRKRIDDGPTININTFAVDPATQGQIDKALGSYFTKHGAQANTRK